MMMMTSRRIVQYVLQEDVAGGMEEFVVCLKLIVVQRLCFYYKLFISREVCVNVVVVRSKKLQQQQNASRKNL